MKGVFFCTYIYFIFSCMYVMLEAYGHLDASCCVIYIAVLSEQLGTARIQCFFVTVSYYRRDEVHGFQLLQPLNQFWLLILN